MFLTFNDFIVPYRVYIVDYTMMMTNLILNPYPIPDPDPPPDPHPDPRPDPLPDPLPDPPWTLVNNNIMMINKYI